MTIFDSRADMEIRAEIIGSTQILQAQHGT